MRTKTLLFVILAAVGVAILGVGVVAATQGSDAQAPTPQAAAAGGPVTQIAAAKAFDPADYRGKPTIVNFWASWCGPCNEEAPTLRTFSESPAGRSVNLVGVNTQDGPDGAQRFIDQYGWNFPIATDPDGKLRDRYANIGLPITVALDASGTPVQTVSGVLAPGDLERLAARLAPAPSA